MRTKQISRLAIVALAALALTAIDCSSQTNAWLPKVVWKSLTLYGDNLTNAGGGFQQQIYENKIVALAYTILPGKELYFFVAKSLETGTDIWKWDDFSVGYRGAMESNRNSYSYNNLFVIGSGVVFYVIDMNTGKTVWAKDFGVDGGGDDGPIGIGKFVFFTAHPENKYRPLLVFRINLETQTIDTAAKIRSGYPDKYPGDFSPYEDDRFVEWGSVSVHINSDNDTLLLVNSSVKDEVNMPRPNYAYFTVYNLSQKRLLYGIRLNDPAVDPIWSTGTKAPVAYNGNAYVDMNHKIFCVRLSDGVILWSRAFTPGTTFSFSGFMIADDKLICNSEDTWMYALDPSSGSELWREKSSGTSSEMLYLDGVIYFTGGGDGLFHAVDIKTGKHKWKISSPDLAHNSDAWFSREEPLVDKQGRVYVRSYESLFCYEVKD